MITNGQLQDLITEKRNQASLGIDELSTQSVVTLICSEDQKVINAVMDETENIVRAVDIVVQSLKRGGRLLYMGSGTSGRLGILDAAELLPTYGVGEEMVKAIIAGGSEAMFRPIEKAEDDYDAGVTDFLAENPQSEDVVIGITASGRTPYVLGALTKAKELGVKTIGLTCNTPAAIAKVCDITIAPIVGPEVVTGSTRMKAGTAQKLVLNTLSTTVMIKLGKVYQNLMVDMLPTNEKLRRRAVLIVMEATGETEERCTEVLATTDWNIKHAIVMIKANCDLQKAITLLTDSDGLVSKALARAN